MIHSYDSLNRREKTQEILYESLPELYLSLIRYNTYSMSGKLFFDSLNLFSAFYLIFTLFYKQSFGQ